MIEPTNVEGQPTKFGNDGVQTASVQLIRILFVFFSGLVCGYFLSWQPTLYLSNNFQQILSEPKTTGPPSSDETGVPLANSHPMNNQILNISENSTSPLPMVNTPAPAIQEVSTPAPAVQEVIVVKECWAGPNPDQSHANRPISYSISREYDVMKRWMGIKEYPSIPKIIHQVWVGNSFENAYCKWMDTFRVDFIQKNPSWTYKLWNKQLYEKKYGPMILSKEFDREPIIESKADILRYEVLWREGGIYIDADSIWLERSFDHLLELAKPFGMFTVGHNDEIPSDGINLYMNGAFGVCKCHPAMEHVLRNLQLLYADLYYEQKSQFFERTGPFFFSNALRQFPVAMLSRDVFSPGSWFFNTGGDSFDNIIQQRIVEMKKQYPDALAFQVGFNTHGKPTSDARNCQNWAKEIEMVLWSQINNTSTATDFTDLTCGNMDYSNISFPQPLPPTQ